MYLLYTYLKYKKLVYGMDIDVSVTISFKKCLSFKGAKYCQIGPEHFFHNRVKLNIFLFAVTPSVTMISLLRPQGLQSTPGGSAGFQSAPRGAASVQLASQGMLSSSFPEVLQANQEIQLDQLVTFADMVDRIFEHNLKRPPK